MFHAFVLRSVRRTAKAAKLNVQNALLNNLKVLNDVEFRVIVLHFFMSVL